MQDYYATNPWYGRNDDLKHLVTETHKCGLKVIIDIVANHTAWDSLLMKHPEFYRKDRQATSSHPTPNGLTSPVWTTEMLSSTLT